MDEDVIKKALIADMIMDMLFNALAIADSYSSKAKNKKVEFDKYKLSESQMTYLLKKYDETRYNEIAEMLLNTKED